MSLSRRRLSVPDHLERTLPALLVGDAVVFVPRGEVDRAAMAKLCRRTRQLVRLDRRRILVDLRKTPHLDYRALPALCRLNHAIARHGARLELCGVSEYLETILRFAGLDFLSQHRSRASALRDFSREGGGIAADAR